MEAPETRQVPPKDGVVLALGPVLELVIRRGREPILELAPGPGVEMDLRAQGRGRGPVPKVVSDLEQRQAPVLVAIRGLKVEEEAGVSFELIVTGGTRSSISGKNQLLFEIFERSELVLECTFGLSLQQNQACPAR
jgi:hypothetical protein